MSSSHLAPLTYLALLSVAVTVHAQMRESSSLNPPAARGQHTSQPPSEAARGSLERRPFDALDTNRRGYLTMQDAKQDDWTGRNFRRCNISHDGHLSEVEYTNCPE